ncbi:FliM/FliN family flagellar motor C-terminal domain-containing protein [Motilimonas cestriensis]|uniref:FliM/FliN family flagellar motor C-terminal domain-containing protein n=1 Tax=Motilimonas cestriensis TaxID=2742685 RepID=A0ABS8WH88_9GAMM|nr:FliM/FliN family flagellar motor switch protein [Motilimonas cestriensis]MCE2597126.1 FliM/FliN family flagellar motor C-terminal domain-containing protein [Motilimonas cestriensis]
MENNKVEPSTSLTKVQAEVLNDILIDLTVEIGTLSMTASQLTNIKLGDVLATGVNIKDEVSLIYKSNLIATGRLIDQDGFFAIQVIKLVNE